jgi:hypothetical protein
LFRIFPQNFIRGNAATNNTPNEGEKKNHGGKVKEVEKLQYWKFFGVNDNNTLK